MASTDRRKSNPRVAVIGAGITGLAAAHRLFELSRDHGEPVDIQVLEASDRIGGVIKTEQRSDFVIDHGPDSFLSEKPAALALCERLGITSRLVGTQEQFRRTYVAFNGRLHPLPNGFSLMAPTHLWPLAATKLFSPLGKLRMALDLVLPSRPRKDESLESFVKRRLGRQALERVAQPLVGGIYTADPSTLSLAATMPRFMEMERNYGSVIRALRAQARNSTATREASGARWSLFLSFGDGMQSLVDALGDRLGRQRIQLEHAIESILPKGGSWEIDKTDRYDGVIVALPAQRSGKVLRGVDSALASDLESIRYASSAVVNLAYPREAIPNPLDGFGFVVPHVEKRNIIACSYSSMKYAGRAPAGFALLRVFVGGALRAEVAELSDDKISAAVRKELRELLGIRQEPSITTIQRYPASMPQYELGHLERVQRIENRIDSHKHLEIAGNGFRGVGIPDCIASGERAATALFGDLFGMIE